MRASQTLTKTDLAQSKSTVKPSEALKSFGNEIESAPSFNDIRLSNAEQDDILISLTKYLLGESLGDFAQSTIMQVEDKSNFQSIYCSAKVHVLIGNLERAIEEFEQLVEIDSTFINGFIELGHCHFNLNQNQVALKNYLRAIRVANLTQTEITDQLVYQRTGHLYIKEEKW